MADPWAWRGHSSASSSPLRQTGHSDRDLAATPRSGDGADDQREGRAEAGRPQFTGGIERHVVETLDKLLLESLSNAMRTSDASPEWRREWHVTRCTMRVVGRFVARALVKCAELSRSYRPIVVPSPDHTTPPMFRRDHASRRPAWQREACRGSTSPTGFELDYTLLYSALGEACVFFEAQLQLRLDSKYAWHVLNVRPSLQQLDEDDVQARLAFETAFAKVLLSAHATQQALHAGGATPEQLRLAELDDARRAAVDSWNALLRRCRFRDAELRPAVATAATRLKSEPRPSGPAPAAEWPLQGQSPASTASWLERHGFEAERVTALAETLLSMLGELGNPAAVAPPRKRWRVAPGADRRSEEEASFPVEPRFVPSVVAQPGPRGALGRATPAQWDSAAASFADSLTPGAGAAVHRDHRAGDAAALGLGDDEEAHAAFFDDGAQSESNASAMQVAAALAAAQAAAAVMTGAPTDSRASMLFQSTQPARRSGVGARLWQA